MFLLSSPKLSQLSSSWGVNLQHFSLAAVSGFCVFLVFAAFFYVAFVLGVCTFLVCTFLLLHCLAILRLPLSATILITLYCSKPLGAIAIFCFIFVRLSSCPSLSHAGHSLWRNWKKKGLLNIFAWKMALSKSLKWQVDADNSSFNEEWTDKYVFIVPTFRNAVPVCLYITLQHKAC